VRAGFRTRDFQNRKHKCCTVDSTDWSDLVQPHTYTVKITDVLASDVTDLSRPVCRTRLYRTQPHKRLSGLDN